MGKVSPNLRKQLTHRSLVVRVVPAPARDGRVVRGLGAFLNVLVLRLVQRLHVRHLRLVAV